MRGQPKIAALACVAVTALVFAGCGSGRSDSDAGGDGSPGTAAVETASGSFGDLVEVCGPGDAKGATDLGVTDSQITIGYGDDAGFPQSPGLNHQMSDAMEAFISWCNDAGGINGRTIKGNYHDAKILDVNNAVLDACATDFFLVGQGWSLDASQEQARRGCGLPAVGGYAVSPQFSNAPEAWIPFPVPADYTLVAGAAQLKELFPEKVSKMATMYGNYSATTDSKDKVESAWPDVGYTFLGCDQEYNIQGEADWKPFVQKLKDCGAEIVYFVGSPYPNFENALSAASQIGYEPIWFTDVNFYDQNFAAWNTDGFADNVYFSNGFVPLEEAADNPATQQYVDIMNQYGGDQNQLGEQSASAFLLWATAAKSCGSTLTRACVSAALDEVTSWTGGGMHAEGNPGENLPGECGALIKLSGTGFERVAPAATAAYACDPSYAGRTSGPVLERANLDADRISQL